MKCTYEVYIYTYYTCMHKFIQLLFPDDGDPRDWTRPIEPKCAKIQLADRTKV